MEPPTLHLSKPRIDKLSSKWHLGSSPVDYGDTSNHFAFTEVPDIETGKSAILLQMISYPLTSDGNGQMCFYIGFWIAPKDLSVRPLAEAPNCHSLKLDSAKQVVKPLFWLNSLDANNGKLIMYSVEKAADSKWYKVK